MKKQLQTTWILLLFLLLQFSVRAQYVAESFETPQFPPEGWVIDNNNLNNGTAVYWKVNDDYQNAIDGTKSADLSSVYQKRFLFTKGIDLHAGDQIAIEYDYKPVFEYKPDYEAYETPFKVTIGNDQTIEGQTEILDEFNISTIELENSTEFIHSSLNYTAPSTGTFYIGFGVDHTSDLYTENPGFAMENGDFNVYLDKIIIDSNNCSVPTNLTTTNIQSSSVTLNWDENGSANNWELQVFQPAFDEQLPNPDSWQSIQSNPFTVGNLIPGRTYKAYVRSNCSSTGESAFSGAVNFTTNCDEAVNAPYSLPFLQNSTPDCWELSGDADWKFSVNASYAAQQAGDHTLFQSYTNYAWVDGSNLNNGNNAILTSPLVDISELNHPAIEFYAYSENNSNYIFNQLKLEILNGSEWEELVSINNSTHGWKFYSINLEDYTAQNEIKLRFVGTGTNEGDSFYNDILIDDVSFVEETTCLPIDNIEISNIGPNSATISWDTENSINADLAIGLTDVYFQGDVTDNEVESPFTIQNLEQSTEYKFYVRNNCEDSDSDWSGPFYFTTTCPIETPEYEEDFPTNFDSNFDYLIPDCWSKGSGGNLAEGPQAVSSNWIGGDNGNTENRFFSDQTAVINVSNFALYDWLLTPVIDMSDNTNFELEVTIAFTPQNKYPAPQNIISLQGSDDELLLLYSEEGGNWDILKTWDASNIPETGLYSDLIPLNGIDSEQTQFAFLASTGNVMDNIKYAWHAYYFYIREEVPCPEPYNPKLDFIGSTTAKVSWDNPGNTNNFEVAIVPEGDNPENWQSTQQDNFNFTDLNPETNYEFYVRSQCSGIDNLEIKGPIKLTTRCEALVAPYEESFDFQAFPDCWVYEPTSNILRFWRVDANAGFDAAQAGDHTGNNGFYAWFDGSTMQNNNISYLYTPLVDISSLTSPSIQFYLFSKNTINESVNKLTVEIYNGQDWETLTSVENAPGGWFPYTFDLSNFDLPDVVQVRFGILSQSNGANVEYDDVLIDDISFDELPQCIAPFNIEVSSITETTAEVSWEFTGDNTVWKVEYGEQGFEPGTGTVEIVNGDPNVEIQGLMPNTIYDVYVSTDCNEGGAEKIGPKNFTTETEMGIEVHKSVELTLYPNPVTSKFTLESNKTIDGIWVYDLTGKLMKEIKIKNQKQEVDVRGWSDGIYLIKIESENIIQTTKVIKK